MLQKVPALFFVLALLLVHLPMSAGAASIRDIRLAQHNTFTRTVLEYDGVLDYRINNQSRDHSEVMIEISGVDRSTDRVNATGEEELISASKVETNSSRRQVRVRLKTRGEVAVSDFLLKDPPRLVLDFYPGSAPLDSRAVNNGTTQQTSVNGGSGRRTIVVDPGHGGHHKGGVGKLNGRTVYEKDVTRGVAFKLEKLLRADPRFDVKLTIRKDEYLGLADRTRIATRLNGDLFISIHTNAVDGAAAQRRARGFEIWTWNREGSKRAAAKAVEQMENDDPGVSRSNSPIINSLMLDALESQALVSRQAASAFESSFLKHKYFRDHYRGIDSARFKVLEIYDMPSILVELGFITHPEEVKVLFTDHFQQLCAKALYEGTVTFFERNDPTFPRLTTHVARSN